MKFNVFVIINPDACVKEVEKIEIDIWIKSYLLNVMQNSVKYITSQVTCLIETKLFFSII